MSHAKKTPRVFLGVESLAPGNGGICRVARLIAKVLVEEVRGGSLRADAIALSDQHLVSDLGLNSKTSERSRSKFVMNNWRAALTHDHFIYDFVGMARAHCRLPFLCRPFMTYIHGIEVWEGTRPDRIEWAHRADFLLSNTAYTRDRADALFGGMSRAKVCWLATEHDEPPQMPASNGHPPTVLILGRMDNSAYKGHDELIDCWKNVVAAVPDARLRIAGGGPDAARLKEKAAQSPVASRIEFAGFVPEDQLPTLWSQATVFAMPSRGEGFGLVYIEAMRHGVPVIASIHDAAPEINLDGITGYNIDLERRDHLTDRVVGLLRDPDAAARIGRQGKARWLEHFRYSAFKQRFKPLLWEFLATK